MVHHHSNRNPKTGLSAWTMRGIQACTKAQTSCPRTALEYLLRNSEMRPSICQHEKNQFLLYIKSTQEEVTEVFSILSALHNLRSPEERESQQKEKEASIRFVCGQFYGDIFLILGWCRRVQPNVGAASPGQVILPEKAMGIKLVSNVPFGL